MGRLRNWRKWKLAGICAGALLIAAGAFLVATNAAVLRSTQGRIYSDVTTIPPRPVALVLGTSPRVGEAKNIFFERRMAAAAKLFKAGKVDKLLVSGDNGSRGYDEPTAMQQALMARGIPEKAIALDFAGFRTLDSVVRAKEVFGVQTCTIVTDDFHLPRALYIAEEKGIDAVGFQTVPVPPEVSPRTFIRELGARALVWIDLHILNRQPRFLGPKETL